MVWGSTYLVTTEFLPADRPLLAATVRALPAGIVLMLVTRTWPRGSWWFKAAALGALNIGLFFFLLFFTAYQLPGGLAALVMSIQPLFVLFLGVLWLGERIRLMHVVACAVGAAGVGLLVLRSDATLTFVGVLAGMVGALSMAAGIVLTKRWGRPDGYVLPQSMSESVRELFSEGFDPDTNVDYEHERIVHTLGNLTLSGYNSELSNKPFHEKCEMLAKSGLAMNREIAAEESWGVERLRPGARNLPRR